MLSRLKECFGFIPWPEKKKPAKIAYKPEFIAEACDLLSMVTLGGALFLLVMSALLIIYGLACHFGIINFLPVL